MIGARRLAEDGRQLRLLSMVNPDLLVRILCRMLDEDEFLSPYGIRTLSASYREQPFRISLGGEDLPKLVDASLQGGKLDLQGARFASQIGGGVRARGAWRLSVGE